MVLWLVVSTAQPAPTVVLPPRPSPVPLPSAAAQRGAPQPARRPAAVPVAAGLRIKENKEVYEGVVTELTPEYTESEVGRAWWSRPAGGTGTGRGGGGGGRGGLMV